MFLQWCILHYKNDIIALLNDVICVLIVILFCIDNNLIAQYEGYS